MLDIGQTKPGTPRIYISGVHFYNSPPEVYQNLTGFPHPDSNDQAYVDLEPVSLFPFKKFFLDFGIWVLIDSGCQTEVFLYCFFLVWY